MKERERVSERTNEVVLVTDDTHVSAAKEKEKESSREREKREIYSNASEHQEGTVCHDVCLND